MKGKLMRTSIVWCSCSFIVRSLAATLAVCLLSQSGFSQETQAESKDDTKPKVEMLTCELRVVDPDGNPIDDVTIYCSGMRTRIRPGSHWGWKEEYGPIPRIKTNEQGIAQMPYPQYVTEKLLTGEVTWTVEHPDFVAWREDRDVINPAEIQLERGFKIAVTAIDSQGEKIKDDLYGVIGGSVANWQLKSNGMLVSPAFAPGDNLLRVVRLADGQPTLFSERIKVQPGDKSRILLQNVKLSMGTRVEGKLEDEVPRPVKNGIVLAWIAKRATADLRQRKSWNWSEQVSINADGTFVFESLPEDEVLQLIAVCDGWNVSKPEKGEILTYFPDGAGKLNTRFSLPQLFKLQGDSIEAEIRMEESTSAEITVQDQDGNAIADATVHMWPNQLWFDSGSQILGSGFSLTEYMKELREKGKVDRKTNYRFSGETDSNGRVEIQNLPVGHSESIAVEHDDFEMEKSDSDTRNTQVKLEHGKAAKLTIKLQPKGTDQLGVVGEREQFFSLIQAILRFLRIQ